ncbi:MAG: phosphatase PAP2 family protein [Anaerolineaceae bacterium]|nr:phosphatase PAP2 family protein [Anaerolineaceae bacterium]
MMNQIFSWINLQDEKWSQRLRLKQENKLIWPAAVFFAHSGDSWFCLLALSVIWLFSKSFWHNHAALMGVATVSMAVIVLGIKFMVRRKRPEGEWGAIYRKSDPHSFPSGHAARTALLAVMAIGLGPAWFGWLLLIWAPAVSAARVITGLHYLSDVLVGIFVGAMGGILFLALSKLIMQIFPFAFL